MREDDHADYIKNQKVQHEKKKSEETAREEEERRKADERLKKEKEKRQKQQEERQMELSRKRKQLKEVHRIEGEETQNKARLQPTPPHPNTQQPCLF